MGEIEVNADKDALSRWKKSHRIQESEIDQRQEERRRRKEEENWIKDVGLLAALIPK